MSRSRYSRRQLGANTFTATTPTCPPGQHYVPDPTPVIRGLRGMSACVPNTIAIHPLVFRGTPAPAAAPAPVVVTPLVFSPPAPAAAAPAPAPFQPVTSDAGPAPAATPTATACPDLWPWWWLLVAFGVGAGGAYYVQKNQKKAKRNVGRVVNAAAGRIVNGMSDAAIARLVG